MGVSKDNHYLVTGDTEGMMKVWDIQDYCQNPQQDQTITTPPRKFYKLLQTVYFDNCCTHF